MHRNDIKMFHAEGWEYVKTKWEKRSWLWEEMKEGLHVSCQSVMGEWEPGWRQSQSKGIIGGEDWRAEVVWMGLILKGWGTHGKHPGFHYSEGRGSSRWVLSGVRTWIFHFQKITLWIQHDRYVGKARLRAVRLLRMLLWSSWEVMVVWSEGVHRTR